MLQLFGMTDCKSTDTPEQPGLLLLKSNTGEPTSRPYREVLGKLMYAMCCTRFDFAHAVRHLSNSLLILAKTIGRLPCTF
jgi:hypothetical protein